MKRLPIDINCDMGESLGDKIIGQDEQLMPLVTSCNIACGFHGGDPMHMRKTVTLALEHKVRIGAHPSYPDLEGFGRREVDITHQDLKSILIYQIGGLKSIVESEGGVLSYVKPHGALYNKASVDRAEAKVVIDAIKAVDSSLALMGLASSKMELMANEVGIKFIAEAFCDRAYNIDGLLKSRKEPNAVYTNVEEVINQVSSLIYNHKVYIGANEFVPIKADSICVHGDNPSAVAFLKGIHKFFNQ